MAIAPTCVQLSESQLQHILDVQAGVDEHQCTMCVALVPHMSQLWYVDSIV